jgi:hypothetical protein
VNVNWDKLQTISNGVLSTIGTTTNATSTSGGGVGPIQAFLGNSSTTKITPSKSATLLILTYMQRKI